MLIVRCSAVGVTPRAFLIGQVTRVFSPSWPRSARTAWLSSVQAVSASSRLSWVRAQVVSCSRPGRTGEVHNGHPSGAVITWMFAP